VRSVETKSEAVALQAGRASRPVSPPERRFYADNKAFGRLGIRWFRPQLMAAPHAHGHIEMNWLTDGEMDYDIDGRRVAVASQRLVIFWAGISHQTIGLDRGRDDASRQCNVYLPLDVFLQMPKLGRMREMLMTGAMISLKPEIVPDTMLQRWYEDYRSGNPERVEILKAEIHAAFRRATLLGWEELLPPWEDVGEARRASVVQVGYVVAMLRHILEHLGESLSAPDVARVVGLHPNYALNLFSTVMQVPLRQFVIRMRLVRARTLLFETELPINSVGFAAGFSSTAQFYEQFKRAYGITPLRMRESYFNPEVEERRVAAE
jgi:AraC-like DNA-binding protein